jgi:glycosyltransferase involved in cell wall biosynthesis
MMYPYRYRCPVKIRYVLHTAYGAGGTIRTVINQANAMCADHDVEIASVYRTREVPAFAIDPRVRLVPLTSLQSDGTRNAGDSAGGSRLLNKARRFKNPMPHKHDYPYKRWDPVVDAAIIRYLRRQRDGILVTTRPALNLLSAYFAPKRVIRIAQDHMNLESYKPALRDAIVKAYPRLDAITVLTEHDLAGWRAALPPDAAVRLARIPNGIPPWAYPPAALDAKVLIAAGRLGSQKGFDLLLDAYATVAPKHPDWQLHIYGVGDWQQRLEAQIETLGLAGKALLRGMARSLDERFSQASIYVLSSRKEGLPMVLLEAMTAGLPPVSFDCPTGPAEVIKDGVNGLLIPPQDPAALAAGICALIEDPERRRAMGVAARESSAAFSMPMVRAAWENLFAELAAGRDQPRSRPAA